MENWPSVVSRRMGGGDATRGSKGAGAWGEREWLVSRRRGGGNATRDGGGDQRERVLVERESGWSRREFFGGGTMVPCRGINSFY